MSLMRQTEYLYLAEVRRLRALLEEAHDAFRNVHKFGDWEDETYYPQCVDL